MRCGGKAVRQDGDLVGVAHQADLLGAETLEQRAGGIHFHGRLAVFAGGAGRDCAAKRPCGELCAVADTEHRDAEVENALVAMRRILAIDAVGAAGQDDADWGKLLDLLCGHVAGLDDGIDAALAHTARDQLLILAAEVENENGL